MGQHGGEGGAAGAVGPSPADGGRGTGVHPGTRPVRPRSFLAALCAGTVTQQ